ncbi:MAG: transglycosylase SLT domain-containing protein [Chitinispirillaceae bacterium]|nr:transglycosylase SLT domain-containing protein [Chitinispirillaceae bacterium]
MSTSAITTSSEIRPQSPPDRTAQVARQFEALFSSMMFKAMRNTVGKGSLLPVNMGEKIFTSMLDDQYSELMGTQGTLGLAELIEKELRQYEGNIPPVDAVATPAWMLDKRLLGTGSNVPASGTRNVEQLAARVEKWNDLISEAAQTHSVDRDLVAAVIAQESGGNQFAVSRAGAKGLMQLMDSTAVSLGVTRSFDPEQNINGGARYLRQMLDKHNGDERLALASYNAGPGAVDKYGGIPPYRETRQYVRSVLDLKNRFTLQRKSGE